jgi:suppressor of tumorigenicity protein 13
MGDASVEATEADEEAAAQLKSDAMDAQGAGDLAKALSCFSGAILKTPTAALYACRAKLFMLLKRPNAAVQDCIAALTINPNSARALRVRGMALLSLGHWQDARKDLLAAQQNDYDDETQATVKLLQAKNDRVVARSKRQADKRAAAAKRAQVRPQT